MSTIRITVNGTVQDVEQGRTVRDLLEQLEIPPRNIAIERNDEFLPPEKALDTVLGDGDKIELVRFVGGG